MSSGDLQCQSSRSSSITNNALFNTNNRCTVYLHLKRKNHGKVIATCKSINCRGGKPSFSGDKALIIAVKIKRYLIKDYRPFHTHVYFKKIYIFASFPPSERRFVWSMLCHRKYQMCRFCYFFSEILLCSDCLFCCLFFKCCGSFRMSVIFIHFLCLSVGI